MDPLPVDAVKRSDANASWRALQAMAAIGSVGNAAYFAVGWFSQSAFATLSVGGVALGACIAAGVRIGRREQLRTRRIAELALAGLGIFVGLWLLITMIFAVVLFSGALSALATDEVSEDGDANGVPEPQGGEVDARHRRSRGLTLSGLL